MRYLQWIMLIAIGWLALTVFSQEETPVWIRYRLAADQDLVSLALPPDWIAETDESGRMLFYAPDNAALLMVTLDFAPSPDYDELQAQWEGNDALRNQRSEIVALPVGAALWTEALIVREGADTLTTIYQIPLAENSILLTLQGLIPVEADAFETLLPVLQRVPVTIQTGAAIPSAEDAWKRLEYATHTLFAPADWEICLNDSGLCGPDGEIMLFTEAPRAANAAPELIAEQMKSQFEASGGVTFSVDQVQIPAGTGLRLVGMVMLADGTGRMIPQQRVLYRVLAADHMLLIGTTSARREDAQIFDRVMLTLEWLPDA